jgi:hypothetical protein
MLRVLLLWVLILMTLRVDAQSFEVASLQENYKGFIGEIVKAPLRLKNTSERPIVLVVRKIEQDIGSTQKNFFCLEGNCLEEKIEDYIVKLEPGQTLSGLNIGLEGGLVPGISIVRYLVFNKFVPAQSYEIEFNFSIEEKPAKQNIYQSKVITVKDVYPNPANEHAFVDYHLTNERTKAVMRVHNLLGNLVGEFELSPYESLLRIKTEELNPGIYFYTLYIDNESVLTRKLLVVKK